MLPFKPGQVVSGSWGKVYINGREIAEIEECECKYKFESKDVKLHGGEKGKKNTGVSLEIKLKMKKVYSYELELVKNVSAGKLNTYMDLNVQLDDPEALGGEAIAIPEALVIGEIDILSFTREELCEREFTLSALPSAVQLLDSIEDI